MTRAERVAAMDGRTVDDMVAAIADTYRRATAADLAAGRDWYPTAGRIVDAIAASAGMSSPKVAMALAALSPRNPWRWNVADAYRYAHAAYAGDPMPTATTFGVNQRRAWAILTTGDAWTSAAPKVRAFVSAILGDRQSVVVDVWAIRVASRGALDRVSNADYGLVARAYRLAAATLGESPRDLQAITWLTAEREGLGSKRRGRHGETFKAGTPEPVRRMFEGMGDDD